ncbi:MAG: SpoVG family protein [Endomicrobium sp.]|jgi:DNA-binding cell septation regulator SpoVG|nr:SpoVG family protein [Endomicrobium sp.]
MQKIKVVFTFCAAILFCACCVYAELFITDIEKNADEYTVTFNNSIKISGVSLSNGKVSFPEYARGGKIYKNFSVLQREFAKKLFEDIEANKISKTSAETAFKINKFKTIASHKTIKAFASVIFEEKFEVECRIMDGKYGLWIAWPSKKIGTSWKKEFIIINKYLKNNIENELIQRYNKQYEQF